MGKSTNRKLLNPKLVQLICFDCTLQAWESVQSYIDSKKLTSLKRIEGYIKKNCFYSFDKKILGQK